MKLRIITDIMAVIFVVMAAAADRAAALSTAFTYQGQLQQSAVPANGTCDFRFSLHDEAAGGTQIGVTELHQGVSVVNGLFTVLVNEPGHFGPGAFDGADRWLQVEVRCPGGTGSFATLGPRQKLTATPYALYAPAAGVADDLLCAGCVGSNDLANGAVTAAKIAGGTIQQSNLAFTPGTITSITAGTGLTGGSITTSGTIAANIGTGPGTVAAGNHTHDAAYWKLAGNAGTSSTTNFLGTTDNQPLDLKVFGARALRLEPRGSPNLIGGWEGNTVVPPAVGATIAGGGAADNGAGVPAPNKVLDDYGAVGGGLGNQAGSESDYARYATVAGGFVNIADGTLSAVVGGLANRASGAYAAVGGGSGNSANGPSATIAGGDQNTASGSSATVGGGASNVAGGEVATVAGGASNSANEPGATVGGGGENTAGRGCTIGGGSSNHALGRGGATVGGGKYNSANGAYATISGGSYNTVINADYATIAGGGPSDPADPSATNNRVYDEYGTIGGGGGNRAGSDDSDTGNRPYATVGGGGGNTATGAWATIGGGMGNQASGQSSTVCGGGSATVLPLHPQGNRAHDDFSTIAGGAANVAGSDDGNSWSGAFATVCGGGGNNATGHSATIGGGSGNWADAEDAAVGGGFQNQAGGARATVVGGYKNVASANAATVPGGADNTASGAYSFAAGAHAQATHAGSFVWSSAVSQASWGNDTFTARAPGGFRFYFDAGDGYCQLSGPTNNWQCFSGSDRETKTEVAAVNDGEVLQRLAAVPIHTWRYRAAPLVRHIGPMAQDFSAAFGVGEDDTHINTVDADGVALAAIQGLYRLLQEKDAEIAALAARVAALEGAKQ